MGFVPDKTVARGRFVPDTPADATGQPPLGWNPPAIGPEANVPASAPSEPSLLSDLATAVQPIVDPAVEALKGIPGVLASGVTQIGAGLRGVATGGGQAVLNLIPGAPHENAVDAATRAINESILQPDSNLSRGASDIATGASRGVGDLARKAGVPESVATEIESQLPNVASAAAVLAGGPRVGAELVAPRGSAPRAVPLPEIIKTARSMNIKLRPSSVQKMTPGSEVPGTTVEGLNPPSDLEHNFVLHNQQQITREAGTEIGVHNADRLDQTAFDKVKAPEFDVYRQADNALRRVAPSPEFSQLVTQGADAAKLEGAVTTTKVIGALRRKAAKEINSDVIATQESGYTKRKLADTIEEAFGQQLSAVGETDLLAKYQTARQKLAKINDVESATKAGQVDAAVLTRLADKGIPLTGRLKMIADINEHFPSDTKHSLKAPAGGKPPAAGLSKIPTLGLIQKGVETAARNLPIPGWRSRFNVRSPQFQNRLGPIATAEERARFGEYGTNPPAQEPGAPPESQLGMGGIPFAPSNAIPPGRAQTLAGDLGLAPEGIPSPEQFPPAPARMTAEVPPPVRGDVNFTPSQLEASTLAGDLGRAPEPARVPGSIDYTPAADTSLAEGLGVAPPRLREQGKLPVETKQNPQLQLTQPGTKISQVSDKAGNHTIRAEGGGELTAKSDTARGVIQVTGIEVPRAMRRQGRAREMMTSLLALGKKRGEKIISDNRVSEPQAKVYEDMEKAGIIQLKRNPVTKQASGELVSKSELKPVFEILGAPATE
jgi:hypothetical protein